MNTDDRSVRTAFEDLQRTLDSTVDVEAAHRRLEQLQGEPKRGSARTKLVIATAAAAVVVLVAMATMWPSEQTAEVVSGGTIAPSTTEAGRAACPASNQLFIYMAPDASPVQIYDVSAYLGNLDGVYSVQYVNEEDTYEEFTRLFSDQPDLVESVGPADLPTSFRPARYVAWDADTLTTLESFRGVKRVETAADHRPPGCVQGAPSGTAEEPPGGPTGSKDGDNDVPGKGVVDQPLGPMVPTDGFRMSEEQREAAGYGTNSAPVAHDTDPGLIGYIDLSELFPTSRPASDDYPPPMTPIWNEDREQIGWWADGLGWVTFEEVSDPDFNFRERWLAERATTGEAVRSRGAIPPEEEG